ncbi:MAG TPA: ATP-binding cassette domain-containing protein, partial [Lachnospiraceae bacterium]|nr:ATP-binding cassette domain-containing protein [Lachnospiraceae bacterium]
TRLGRTTIELDSINKAYGDKILIKDFSYIFLNNDRVGFIGCNGCGKTTLMKIIAGKIQADSGNLMVGQTVKIGYYTQEIATSKEEGISYMNPEDKVIDYIRNTAEFVQTKEGSISASQMLERFLFPASAQYSRIGKLSGGEKRRLNLLRVLMEAPNVLILDEPTNDLDIATLTILEDYIDRFDGIVICVSHDRFFLDRIIKRIFAFEENGNMRQYEGGYTDFVNKKAEREIESQGLIKEKEKKGIYKNSNSQKSEGCETQIATEEIVINDGRVRERKLKFSFQEQKDYETIEDDIAKIELKLEDLGKKTTQFSSDFIKLNEIALEKENTEGILEEKMQRWMYLEELAVRISEN